MAAGYVTLTTTRLTLPDLPALQAAVKAATGDPTAVVQPVAGAWRGKKDSGPWSPAHTAAAQQALDTTPETDQAISEVDVKVLKAVAGALWECIPNPLLTKVAMRARAIAIWKALP